MGIGFRIFAFLRPSEHGDWGCNFRVFEASTTWGKGQDWTAGKQRERDRVREREREREIPEFPKPRAPALRFGSMNPISRVLGPWEHGGKLQRPESRSVAGKKL